MLEQGLEIAMNRNHLIQFVATVGAVLVLYVLSCPFAYAYCTGMALSDPETMDVAINKYVARLKIVYAPVYWLSDNVPLFASFMTVCFDVTNEILPHNPWIPPPYAK
jgi:hypothetical protein